MRAAVSAGEAGEGRPGTLPQVQQEPARPGHPWQVGSGCSIRWKEDPPRSARRSRRFLSSPGWARRRAGPRDQRRAVRPIPGTGSVCRMSCAGSGRGVWVGAPVQSLPSPARRAVGQCGQGGGALGLGVGWGEARGLGRRGGLGVHGVDSGKRRFGFWRGGSGRLGVHGVDSGKRGFGFCCRGGGFGVHGVDSGKCRSALWRVGCRGLVRRAEARAQHGDAGGQLASQRAVLVLGRMRR
jgi:hypothetical protein